MQSINQALQEVRRYILNLIFVERNAEIIVAEWVFFYEIKFYLLFALAAAAAAGKLKAEEEQCTMQLQQQTFTSNLQRWWA